MYRSVMAWVMRSRQLIGILDCTACWSNTSLIDFVTERVKVTLRAAPTATIVSVSQNGEPPTSAVPKAHRLTRGAGGSDNSNYCKDPGDMAMIEQDGSPIGP